MRNNTIEVTIATAIDVREAKFGDAEILFRWLNAADRRAASFETSTVIRWEDHVAWLNKHLGASEEWHAVACIADTPAGQIRIEQKNQGLFLSIYIDEEFRNRSVGRSLVEAACNVARVRWPGLPLVAEVRHDNQRSVGFFEHNGFERVAGTDERLSFKRFP